MIGPGAQLHLLHRRFKQISADLINRTELANFTRPHIGIGLQICDCKALALNSSGQLNPLSHGGARFAGALVAELFKRNTGYFHVNINSIQQRAGYSFLVTLDHSDGAGTFFFGVGVKTTQAGLQTKLNFRYHFRSFLG